MFNLATYHFFSLLIEAVYLVGMTKVQLYFMCKVTYNSNNVDQICPKFDIGIYL